MAGGLFPVFMRQLWKSLAAANEGVADADLLDRFLARRDEKAFTARLGRHGPMVLGVCGRPGLEATSQADQPLRKAASRRSHPNCAEDRPPTQPERVLYPYFSRSSRPLRRTMFL
jgi:hypothetical protein